MKTIVRNVRDIEASDRSALEHIVGQALRDNQRLIIQIAEVDVSGEVPADDSHSRQALSDWTNVYEGLGDEEIEAIDQSVKRRANLTRNLS